MVGVFAGLARLPLAFYGGFFGPGIVAFRLLALVSLLGRSLRRAKANAKMLTLASNIGALPIFTWGCNLRLHRGQAAARPLMDRGDAGLC